MVPFVLRISLLFALVYVSDAFIVQKTLRWPQSQDSLLLTRRRNHALFLVNNNDPSPTRLSVVPLDTSSLLLATDQHQSLSLLNKDVWIFIAGIIPFAWATVEFWRRIAVGQPFGTGSDSIYIGKDNAPDESRGRRVLDRGAFLVAYILFGIAAAAIGITLYSVVTSPAMIDTSLPPQM